MTPASDPVLEFPALLHGALAATRRRVGAESHRWTQEFLQMGSFTPPQRVRPVLSGEVVITHMGAEFLAPAHSWRLHVFIEVFTNLGHGLPAPERQRIEDTFETFCLGTSWGVLHYCVAPPPKRSAERMARRLAALLRFWKMLEGPRYAFWSYDQQYTLEELVQDIYGKTLEAWCPSGSSSVRGQLALTVDRMARATRQECEEAVLRMISSLLATNSEFKHREVLGDPDFQRERLAALSPNDFENVSSAYRYAVNGLVHAWDRYLGRP
jgi:hypothetical protein